MDIAAPKPKKYCRLPKPKLLPIIRKANGELHQFQGIFDGFTVQILDKDDMKNIVSMGYFGKASLSKSYPQFDGTLEKPEILRKRQLENRKKLPVADSSKENRKVIVLPDSDDDEEESNYFTNLKANYEMDKTGSKESVNLMLEEAFFLKKLGCIEIKFEGETLDIAKMWELFSDSDPFFRRNYAVYYHFRCERWIVKPGIKFGGDYLLYKWGPPFYHASYLVKIRNYEEPGPMNSTGLERLCESSGKELLICSVSLPSEQYSFDDLKNVEIRKTKIKRWILSQERENNS